MPDKVRLNKRNIAKLTFPEKDSIFYHDDQLQGLAMRATCRGSLIWTCIRRIKGSPAKIRLGRYPDLPPDDARAMCLEMLGRIAKGEDPRERQQVSGLTLGGLFDQYLEEHAKPFKATWEEDEATFDRYLQPFRTKLLSDFTKQTVRRIHLKLKNTPVAANRTLALLSKMFNFAIDEAEVWQGANPAKGVKRFKEQSRTRYLTSEEIPRFLDALRKEKPLFRDFFLICIYTGARKKNVRQMRAEELDLNQAVWMIPDPKNGEPTPVHLPPQAVAILKAKPRTGWIFPSPSHLVSGGPLRDPKAAWDRIRERSGLHDLNMHDLRRSLGSWQAIQGASLPVIGKSLGHKSLSSTEIYARLCMTPVRESVDAALDQFNQLLEQSESDPSEAEHPPAE